MNSAILNLMHCGSYVNISVVAVMLLILLSPFVCGCLLVLTELSDSAVVTSRAASGLPRSVCRPPATDTHPDVSSRHATGLIQPEQEDELSDTMMARHMSIKER